MKDPHLAPPQGGYRVEARDFGPIARASLDLRPLTILVGPSNTGKSYLAILVYALHRCFIGSGLRLRRFGGAWSLSLPGLPAMGPDRSREQEHLPRLAAWMSKASVSEEVPPLPPDLLDFIHARLHRDPEVETRLQREIGRCFGTGHVFDASLRDLVRFADERPAGPAKVVVRFPWGNGDAPVEYNFRFDDNGVTHSASIPRLRGLPGPFLRALKRAPIDLESDDDQLPRWLARLLHGFYREVFRPLLRNVYYLPADRTGLMHSLPLIEDVSLDRLSMPQAVSPLMSGVVTDFLRQLTGIRPRRPWQKARDMAGDLETALLQGTVHVKDEKSGTPEFSYRPQGWSDDLPLMRASSMVLELTPIVLFLRYLIRPGDGVIIEEPEAHLHPAAQTMLARELVRLVDAGVQVIITTHSDWFLEQIGNLVQLSSLEPARRSGIADMALEPKQVGAWLFKPDSAESGSVVEEIVVDPETGLFPTDYNKVSEALYNESAMIFNRLQESSEK